MRSSPSLIASILLVAGAIADVHAENWPQWRGARLDGVSHEKNVPTTWSETENVLWRIPLPGPAGSTPVVWEDRIFLTSAADADLVLICADTAGKEQWRRTVSTGDEAVRGDEGNYASPSPITDGKHVWTTMGTGHIACYDFAGNEVWKIDLQERFGKFSIQFGFTSTPVLHKGRLYQQMLHSDAALVVALDAATGETIWTHNRASDATAECEHSYASPVLYQDDEKEFLVTHGADYVVAHQLSDGAEIFRCGGLNPKDDYNPTLRFVASPVAAPGIIVAPSAKNGPVVAISPDAKGDVSDSQTAVIWFRPENTPDVPSPLVADGLVYLCRENGFLICIDAKTGEEYYNERTHNNRHRASPVYADGKVYLTARDGVVTVVKAGKQFEMLAQNSIGEAVSSSPVISGGRIYLRTFDSLVAIGAR